MVVTLPYWMAHVQPGHCRGLLLGSQWPDEGRRGNQVMVSPPILFLPHVNSCPAGFGLHLSSGPAGQKEC